MDTNYTQDDKGVDACQSDMRYIMIGAAEMSLKNHKARPKTKDKTNSKRTNNTWYSASCKQMKDQTLFLGKLLQKCPLNPKVSMVRGHIHVKQKKCYKAVCI